MSEKLVAYKGFNADWTCRDFKYEVGKTYEESNADLCKAGFHACEYPLDILSYYPPTGQMAVVELEDVSDEKELDTKRVAKKITIKASISLCDLITASVKYTMERVTVSGAASNSGDRGAASNSGVSGAASNSGDSGAASNSGDRGAASNSGDSGAASNSGDRGAASNSGYSGAASNSGKFGIAADFNGFYTKVQSCEGGAIVIVKRADDGSILHIRASKVGENGIKPDVWYSLTDAGEFEEVK